MHCRDVMAEAIHLLHSKFGLGVGLEVEASPLPQSWCIGVPAPPHLLPTNLLPSPPTYLQDPRLQAIQLKVNHPLPHVCY